MLERELNPLHRQTLERAHALARELGWPSYREMYQELKQIDLGALEQQTSAFLRGTAGRYRETVEPHLRAQVGVGFDELRRSDLPHFFRAPGFDDLFPSERIVAALEQTLGGTGDRPARPVQRAPRHRGSGRARARARSARPVSVPDEVYLVIARHGGRDDYAALFHEAGHTEHYANVEASLPFEFRYLGDNSVTEGFAFLFEHLTEDPAWLRAVLGADDPDRLAAYGGFTRASKFVFLRRYAAKLSYELELHGGERPLDAMPALYSRLLGDAVGVDWPAATYLADVDARLLRRELPARVGVRDAPARRARRALRARVVPVARGRRPAAHAVARGPAHGRRRAARRVTGERLDFGVMTPRCDPCPPGGGHSAPCGGIPMTPSPAGLAATAASGRCDRALSSGSRGAARSRAGGAAPRG